MGNAFFGYVGISDVVDIIATSILIYYALLLIRGTRAVQILTGILVLVALLGIANLFHLYLLGTLLRLIVVGAAVTIPIVFQPELRRALEQIGRGGIFQMRSDVAKPRWARTEDRVVAVLARAAYLLSRVRRGALIVIEQQSALKEYCESGTILHADLSEELLLMIFMRSSPLHDGAAIVREGHVEAAGCVLPLAEQLPGNSRIGTRHRAALGLSEQTDAVVIVISEQTGNVSIARNGRLSRPIEDEERLRKMLLAVTRPPRQPRRRNDFIAHLRLRLRAQRREGQPRAS
ncbi:MAG: TIGR00159 family protein [Candidatus Eremiobacteraeota bacterium]|nr:TIGR00159 family protein [Candidatus Eremiobacteraeota bacterium]